MFKRIKVILNVLLLVVFVLRFVGPAFADNAVWRVGQLSGEVWIGASSVKQASLTNGTVLNPGDSIRTGRNGRILLVRGETRMLISPNSVVAIPANTPQKQSTIITQQSGAVFYNVKKRHKRHFEVTTPLLAAVVKGTQFHITVNGNESHVNVVNGQVEVVDFRSGQFAQVSQGQTATVRAQGRPGLSLSGSGSLGPIQNGTPKPLSAPSIPASEDPSARHTVPPDQPFYLASPQNKDEAEIIALKKDRASNDAWSFSFNYLLPSFADGNYAPNHIGIESWHLAVPVTVGFGVAFAVRWRRIKRKAKNTDTAVRR